MPDSVSSTLELVLWLAQIATSHLAQSWNHCSCTKGGRLDERFLISYKYPNISHYRLTNAAVALILPYNLSVLTI